MSMPDLEIPDEAVSAADLWSGQIPRRDLRAALEAALPLAVAAELDRLADEWEPKPLPDNVTLAHGSAAEQHREMNWTFAVRLRARARDLRGQA